MKNIRIGNDILLNFPIILENSTIEQIRKMNFKVFVMPSKSDVTESSTPETPADKYKYRICDNHEMYNWKFDEFKKHHKHACELSHKIVEVEDDKYVFEAYFPAYHQHVLGKYDVIIFGNHKEVGQCVCDQKEFVNLVEHSEDADQVFTEDAEPILVLHPLMIEYGKLHEIEQAEKDRIRAEQYRVNNEINREAAERLRNSEFSNKLNKPKVDGTEGQVLSLNSNGETIWKNEEGGGVSEETVDGKIRLVTDYVWDQFLHKSEKNVILNSLEATHNYIVNQVDPLIDQNIENIESLTDRMNDAEEEISKIKLESGDFVKVVNLMDLIGSEDHKFTCDRPFAMSMDGMGASHHREDMESLYRLDCFLHTIFKGYSGERMYSICKRESHESYAYTFLGMLRYNLTGANLIGANGEDVVESIDGKTATEWVELAKTLFELESDEDLRDKVTQIGLKIGDPLQINLPNDRDNLVKAINRLEKRTEMLKKELDKLANLNGSSWYFDWLGEPPVVD